jgi:hypothetical protein
MIKIIGYIVSILTALALIGGIGVGIKNNIVFAGDLKRHMDLQEQKWQEQQKRNIQNEFSFTKYRIEEKEFEYNCLYKSQECIDKMQSNPDALKAYQDLLDKKKQLEKEMNK